MSKISVIVPIYNAEAYLNRCLDSIINQTYSDLEIILINDGSTDNSLDICLEYASKDKRIVVYNQTNKGISKARNKGIELATGDYIGFVDSDDIISPRMYETLYNLMTDEKCLIAGCQYTKFTSSCNFKEDKNYISYTKEEALKKNLNEEISNFLWDKLIKEELFNDIKFKENMIFEDLDVIYRLIGKVDKIVISDSILYGYFQREDSYVHTYSYEKIINYLNVYKDKYDYLIIEYPNLKEELNKNRIFNIFVLFRNIVLSRNKEYLKDAKVILEHKMLKKLIKDTKYDFSFIKNFLIKILSINVNLFYLIASMFYKIKEG